MDRHATLAYTHLEFLQFPVSHEQVSVKLLTMTEVLIVVNQGYKSSLGSVFQPHCLGSGISSCFTYSLHKSPAW